MTIRLHKGDLPDATRYPGSVAIDTETMGRNHETIGRDIGLQGAGSAYPDNIELGKLRFYGSGLKVDIYQGIELVEHDIDIIGTNTGGDNRKAGFAEVTGMGNEFAVVAFMFYAVEVFTYGGHAVGIAHGNNGGGELFGAEVEMVNGPPFIDNQFRFLDALHKKALKRLFQISDKYPTFAHPIRNGDQTGFRVRKMVLWPSG